MDVLLLIPPESWSYQVIPDLGLGYLAAALRRAGHEPAVLDCRQARYNLEDLRRYLCEHGPQTVGIKFHSPGFKRAQEAIAVIRDALPGARIILGGPHPTLDPERTLRKLPADYLIQGEGESSLPLLVDALARGDTGEEIMKGIPGLAWREGEQISLNPPRFSEELDNLGFPAWDLINPRKYPDEAAGIFVKSFPTAPLLTSRGCPYRCAFCAGWKVLGGKLRYRSPGHVVDEIEMLRRDYGVNNFNFVDDNLTFRREFAESLCLEMIKRAPGISWTLPNGVRVDTLDADLVQLMERAGCYQMALGIESGSDRVLELMNKKITTDKIRQACTLIRAHTRIRLTGFFLMGFPGETYEDLQQTVRLMLSLPLDHVHLCAYIPLPGTPSYEELVRQGLLDPEKIVYDKMTLDSPTVSTAVLSAKTVRHVHQYAYFRFYARPRVIANLVMQLNSPGQVWMLMRRFVRLFI